MSLANRQLNYPRQSRDRNWIRTVSGRTVAEDSAFVGSPALHSTISLNGAAALPPGGNCDAVCSETKHLDGNEPIGLGAIA